MKTFRQPNLPTSMVSVSPPGNSVSGSTVTVQCPRWWHRFASWQSYLNGLQCVTHTWDIAGATRSLGWLIVVGLVWGQLWLLCASHKHQGPWFFWKKTHHGWLTFEYIRNFAEFEGEPLLDRHRNTHVFGWFNSLHEMIQYIQGMTLDEKVPLTSTKIYHSWSISPCQIPLKNWQRIRWSELGPGASHISKNPLNMNSYEFLLDSYDMLWLRTFFMFFLTAPNSGTSCFIFWGSPASTRKK